MRVAFPANHYLDPTTPRSWSGLPYFIRRTLEGAGIETVIVPLQETGRAGRWLRFFYWRMLRGRRYLRTCETRQLRDYAGQIERQLAALEVDALFGTSTWFCAYLRTRLPIFFWTDACFGGLVDFYPSFTRLAPPSLRAGHAADQGALERCTRAFYCSEWAARTAQAHYAVAPEKLSIVPFGGNVQEPPGADEVAAAIRSRRLLPCRLLLVGVEWERKGADIAVAAVEALRARGLDARPHTIVGCRPPAGVRLPDSVVSWCPSSARRRRKGGGGSMITTNAATFSSCPRARRLTGLPFSEAGAFGVPCLATGRRAACPRSSAMTSTAACSILRPAARSTRIIFAPFWPNPAVIARWRSGRPPRPASAFPGARPAGKSPPSWRKPCIGPRRFRRKAGAQGPSDGLHHAHLLSPPRPRLRAVRARR